MTDKSIVPVTPTVLLAKALDKGVDAGMLEKMMDLQERYEKNEAKKAYIVAMTAFKADPPKIEKDKNVKYKTKQGNLVDYTHAKLSSVTAKINSALSKHGLSATWYPKQSEGKIAVTCTITHIGGHSEQTTLEAEADLSGGKNAIQAIGSTVSYLERYTLLALTGLATEDMDDDGKGSEVEYITEEEAEKLEEDLMNVNSDIPMFLTFMGCESLAKIPKTDLKKAQLAINAKKKKGQKND